MAKEVGIVSAYISGERLTYFREMLLATGWTTNGEGWLAPALFREQLAMEMGAGHVAMSHAVAAQIQFDEAVIKSAAA